MAKGRGCHRDGNSDASKAAGAGCGYKRGSVVSALLWGAGGSSIICHHGEREVKSTAAARPLLSLTACTVAMISISSRQAKFSRDASSSMQRQGASRCDSSCLPNHQTVIPPLPLHPFLSSSFLPACQHGAGFPPEQ